MKKWTLLRNYDNNTSEEADGRHTIKDQNGWNIARIWEPVGSMEEDHESNALLMTAAPELLEALQAVEGMCNMPEVRYAAEKHEMAYYRRTMRLIAEAIKKATEG